MRLRARLTGLLMMILWMALSLLPSQALPLQAQGQTLLVFAAASLTNAFEEIGTAFEAQHSGIEVLFNFGGSSTLATQLSEGAPADVFASANSTQMHVAQEAGRIGSAPLIFARNRLVLIVPADNPASIQSLRDLALPGVALVVAAPGVPVRDYTDTMLAGLAADPGYGESYREAVLGNIVSEEDNVRQVAAKVALGEADAGIVYQSDVTPDIAADVLVLPIPDAVNTIATYPLATTSDSAVPDLAAEFISLVLSDAGQDILEGWGFISVRIPTLPATVTLPAAGLFTLDGQVLNPLTLSAEQLRTDFTPHTLEVTYLSGEDTISATYTGVLLWDLLSAAQPNYNANVRNDRLSMLLVVTGSDGYQAVVALAEIDPEFGDKPVLLAYDENGTPISDDLGGLRLVVPGDERGGRYVRGVANISLRDAPAVSSTSGE